MIRTALLAALALVCAALPSQARQHGARATCAETGDIMRPVCGGTLRASPAAAGGGFLQGVRSIKVTMHRERRAALVETPTQVVVGGRPAGCPSRFCGCGASLHLFGRIIPGLNLAANWLRFPHADPAPRMAAARPGHVFVLEQHIAGDIWLVYDANSGGHVTRLHARSIAGYAIVNPMGAG
jgi:hypothetical protein